MNYRIFHSFTFDEKLKNFPKDFIEWVDKIETQLMTNPYVGDPIRVKWFREKKKDKYRIYYLIYENLNAVYIVDISEKKDQQQVINAIFLLLKIFKYEIENLIKK